MIRQFLRQVRLGVVLAFIISLSQVGNGQTIGGNETLCDEFPISCDDGIISIEPVASCAGTICGIPCNCRQQRFNVYLNVKSQNNIPPCLNYKNLDIAVGLTFISNQANTKPSSKINIENTSSCNLPKALDFRKSDEIGFNLAPKSNGEPPILIPLSAKTFLFTIIIDVWQGETVKLKCTGATYTYVNNEVEGTCNFNEGDELVYEVPYPDLNAAASVLFVKPLKQNNDQILPLYLSSITLQSGGTQVNHFETTFTLSESEKNFPPVVFLPGDFPGYMVELVSEYMNPVTGLKTYTYRLVIENFIIFGGDELLLNIKISPPPTFQKCGKMCPAITGAVLQIANQCTRPDIQPEQATCVDFKDCLPNCTSAISIKAVGEQVTGIPTTPTCSVKTKIGFDWAGANETIELTKVKLVFEFLGSDFPISNVALAPAMLCPIGNTVSACTGACSTIDGNKLTICFSAGLNGNFIIRKSQNGSSVFSVITFNASQGGCIDGVILTEAEFQVVGEPECVPFVAINNLPNTFPACVPYVSGNVKNEDNKVLTNTFVSTVSNPPGSCMSPITQTTAQGNYSVCICSNEGTYDITAKKEEQDNLNGISTTDLALISRHILGLNPIPGPYRLFAADANKSGTITTLDIVALRRLILGIDEELPGSLTWRFFDKNYQYPNPQNPFNLPFGANPEKITVTSTPANPYFQGLDLIGVKVGDVNNSHTARPAPPAGICAFKVPCQPLKAGEIITLPIQVQSAIPLTALQGAIRFNPDAMEFMGVAKGDVYDITDDCFGLNEVKDGIIRVVWVSFNPEEGFLTAGKNLCKLVFRAKRKLATPKTVLQFDDQDRLRPEGYTISDVMYKLTLEEDTGVETRGNNAIPAQKLESWCAPNPVSGAVKLMIDAPATIEDARLFILHGWGSRMSYIEVNVAKGRNTVDIPNSDGWPSGLYNWVILSGSERLSEGTFVKTR